MVFSRAMPRKKRPVKRTIDPLLEIMARLRAPGGCPWDREQDHDSIKQCLIEEAYEVVEAIESGEMPTLCDELGDLLLQVVFHAQMAKERGDFDFFDVAGGVAEKLIRRHPHVFGKRRLGTSDAVLVQWEKIKKEERAKAGKETRSALDHIPAHLPALLRSEKLLKRAAKAGLHDGHRPETFAAASRKLSGLMRRSKKAAGRELGDLLLLLADLARQLRLEPEQLLRQANGRFEKAVRAREKNVQPR